MPPRDVDFSDPRGGDGHIFQSAEGDHWIPICGTNVVVGPRKDNPSGRSKMKGIGWCPLCFNRMNPP